MLQLGQRVKGNRIPNVVAAGTGATPAAFYLGLCRLRGILSPPASATAILQAGHSFFDATEIRIGRERSQPLRLLQAELFSFAATKI